MRRTEHITIEGVECKKCSACGKYRPLGDFNAHSRTYDGLQSNCRECNVTRNLKIKAKQKEERDAMMAARRKREKSSRHPVHRGDGEKTCRYCKSFSRCSVGGFCLRWKQSVKVGNVCEAYNPDVVKEYKQEAKPVRVGRCTPYD